MKTTKIQIDNDVAPKQQQGRKPSPVTDIWLSLKPGQSFVGNKAVRFMIYRYAMRHKFSVYIEKMDEPNHYRIFGLGTKRPKKLKTN